MRWLELTVSVGIGGDSYDYRVRQGAKSYHY